MKNPLPRTCGGNTTPRRLFEFMIDQDFTDSLLGKFKNLSKRHHEDCLTLDCDPSDISNLLSHLRDEETFDLMVDLTAIDHNESSETRFSVVMHLYSRIHRDYIRIHSLVRIMTHQHFLVFLIFSLRLIGMKGKPMICSVSPLKITLISKEYLCGMSTHITL